MPKSQKIIFYGNGGIPNPSVMPAISIPAGKRAVIRLNPINSEGGLSRVVFYQTSGTSVDFSVDILESGLPFDYRSEPSQWPNWNTPPSAPLQLFRILGQELTATAGNMVSFVSSGVTGFPYINADQPNTTANIRALWLILTPMWGILTPTVTTWEGYIHLIAPFA